MCRWFKASDGICFVWTKNGPVAQDRSSLSNHELGAVRSPH